jgi:ferrous iron transport protein B
LKKTAVKGEPAPFLLELPGYMIPNWRTLFLRIYQRAGQFVWRAGTIILAMAVVVWALSYFPHSDEVGKTYAAKRAALIEAPATATPPAAASALAALDQEERGEYLRKSYFGVLGHKLEPVFKPLGWDWRISCAVLASFPAREVVVSTLGTLFNAGGEDDEEARNLPAALQNATWPDGRRPLFNLPVALALMVFFALCSQCGATLAVIKRETNSWRWPIFSFTYMTVLAYLAALAVYQVGMVF